MNLLYSCRTAVTGTLLILLAAMFCLNPAESLFAKEPLPSQSPFPLEPSKRLDVFSWDSIFEMERKPLKNKNQEFLRKSVFVPRNEVVAFALYTHQNGKLKMTAQMYPLKKEESREVRLEFKTNGQWKEVQKQTVVYPGWYAHFEIKNWDNTKDVQYRVRHGEDAQFEGLIRKDPKDKKVIVVASLSCNSSRDRGGRDQIVKNLRFQNPDLLFFAGDQSYDHTQHTAAWLLFGKQFRDILRDRPVITIPDDHDVGMPNVWGEGGKISHHKHGPDGGYYYPHQYVKMVEAAQTWHLPDPVDPKPIKQGIGVYFTRLNVGGIDFAILEDRKFKSGPLGKIPNMGPRPDHINKPGYDPKKVDVPGLKLLGDRQLTFLHNWGQDWTDAKMKVVLSQTAFCGAVHIHGKYDNRLLADLDSNAWPQTGRNKALREIRAARASHLCGDQHLAVVVKHGIDEYRDGPFGFTNPAIANSVYGRWWWPENEKAGGGERINGSLPWTGDYLDGLHNKITMHAYANPDFKSALEGMKRQKAGEKIDTADGYGLIRYNKATGETTFECWARKADVEKGDSQIKGWPIKFHMSENDGRKVVGSLPRPNLQGVCNPVVQVINEATGKIEYTQRFQSGEKTLPVYALGKYTIKIGKDKPDQMPLIGVPAQPNTDQGKRKSDIKIHVESSAK